MELRRKTQREDRRRRVLRDETTPRSEATGSTNRGESAIAGRTYTDAALAELQPRLTDFLPQRPFAVCMAGLLSLFVVAIPLGLNTLASTSLRHFPAHRTLLITESGTCATWCASLCLFAGALMSLLVFNIRRHKLDDYRGRYGVWVWSAMLLGLASLDVTTGLHALAAEGLTELTGAALHSDGSLWWLVLLGSVGGVVGLRMLIDMRHSPASCCLLLIAATCYCMGAAIHWNWWSPFPVAVTGFVRSTLLLVGHASLFYSLVLYARHVFLDAQGALETSGRRRRQKSSRFGGFLFWKGFHEAWRKRQATKKKRAAEAKKKQKLELEEELQRSAPDDTQPTELDEDDASSDEDLANEDLDDDELDRATDPSIPRSERRKMKKQQRRQQRQAA